jgi:hypothetical protein
MAGTFANGSIFKLGETTVSEIQNISGPNFSADSLDSTTHNNTDDFRTFEKGLIDAGELSIDGLVNYADLSTLSTAVSTRSKYTATITVPTLPSRTKWEARVFVTGLEMGSPHDNLIEYSATLKIDGKPILSEI